MVLYQAKDYKDMSRKAANIISAQVIMKPNAVLGLATGSTPVGAYEQLVEWYNKGDIDFSQVTSVNLDEYKGLSGDNDQSYRYFMNKHLFDKKPFKETFVPNGKAEDLDAASAEYEKIIDAHPVDIQILGIGQNGHIGFNEPCTPLDSLTHIVELTESTINANKRYFDKVEDVPTRAVSMGIGSIMKGKKMILMAYGEAKAEAIKGMIDGPVTTDMPASALQNHQDVVVIIDDAAASKL